MYYWTTERETKRSKVKLHNNLDMFVCFLVAISILAFALNSTRWIAEAY